MIKLPLNINPDSNGNVRMKADVTPSASVSYISAVSRSRFNAWRDRRVEYDEWRSVSLDEVMAWMIAENEIQNEVLDNLSNDKLVAEIEYRDILPEDTFKHSQLEAWAKDNGMDYVDEH